MHTVAMGPRKVPPGTAAALGKDAHSLVRIHLITPIILFGGKSPSIRTVSQMQDEHRTSRTQAAQWACIQDRLRHMGSGFHTSQARTPMQCRSTIRSRLDHTIGFMLIVDKK